MLDRGVTADQVCTVSYGDQKPAASPNDCFDTVYEASRIAVEHMTPVMVLSDGYIANGAEPWKFPEARDLKPIEVITPGEEHFDEEGKFSFHDQDLVYRHFKRSIKECSNAVIFFVMDISGSMTQKKKFFCR